MAAKKVAKVGVKKEKGYLYFVDKAGDVSCAKMARGNKKGGSTKKVAKVGIKKQLMCVTNTSLLPINFLKR